MSTARLAAFAALSLITGTSAPAQAPAQVRIDVYSYGFGPQPIRLAANRPVTLTFVNRAGKSHDFTARTFFGASRILSGAAPGGEIELSPGETRSITLVPPAGVYRVHCSRFLHAQLGMRDTIFVN